MKGILLENKQTGVIISSSQQFSYALLPCPSFSPAWNGAGRYDQVNTHQADDQPPKTGDHALQPEDQTLQPDHQEYQENQTDMSVLIKGSEKGTIGTTEKTARND